ncbi:hypothetical protein ACFQZC_34850 [Streptacidiphilus monticola]
MTKLIALSEDPGHVWFGTSGLFDWAADFALPGHRPGPAEKLRRDAASGYLYLDTVPGPERSACCAPCARNSRPRWTGTCTRAR